MALLGPAPDHTLGDLWRDIWVHRTKRSDYQAREETAEALDEWILGGNLTEFMRVDPVKQQSQMSRALMNWILDVVFSGGHEWGLSKESLIAYLRILADAGISFADPVAGELTTLDLTRMSFNETTLSAESYEEALYIWGLIDMEFNLSGGTIKPARVGKLSTDAEARAALVRFRGDVYAARAFLFGQV